MTGGDKMSGRAWPDSDRRPGEPIADWCRRLDWLTNTATGATFSDAGHASDAGPVEAPARASRGRVASRPGRTPRGAG